MEMRLLTMLLGSLTIATSVAAQSISLHIELALGQSQFRTGEAIGLKLIFEMTHDTDAPPAGQPGWMIMLNGHDRSVLGFGRDRFVARPLEHQLRAPAAASSQLVSLQQQHTSHPMHGAQMHVQWRPICQRRTAR